MKSAWQALIARFAARSRRERLMIAALLVLGPPLAALSLWIEPAWRAQGALQAELTQLRTQSARLANSGPVDPNALARAELAALQAQLTRDQAAVAERSRSMVAPAEMVALLERLLARHPGVRLLAMRSLPAEPWRGVDPAARAEASGGSSVGSSAGSSSGSPAGSSAGASSGSAPDSAGGAAQAGGLYRHGVELELEGGWNALRAYLADIEQSPRRLQWGALQLTAKEHPTARMKISLHTLSLEATWLQL